MHDGKERPAATVESPAGQIASGAVKVVPPCPQSKLISFKDFALYLLHAHHQRGGYRRFDPALADRIIGAIHRFVISDRFDAASLTSELLFNACGIETFPSDVGAFEFEKTDESKFVVTVWRDFLILRATVEWSPAGQETRDAAVVALPGREGKRRARR